MKSLGPSIIVLGLARVNSIPFYLEKSFRLKYENLLFLLGFEAPYLSFIRPLKDYERICIMYVFPDINGLYQS